MTAPDERPLSDEEASARLGPLLTAYGTRGLLLAVSGGPDSVALMRLAAPLAHDCGARVAVASVDHGLRTEAADEVAAVARWGAEAGLTVHGLRLDLPHAGARLQETARQARYAVLAETARAIGAGAIVTAHHRDDQAETVLMRLAAGSGIGGLAGMSAASDLAGLVLARPFLDLPKARLVATCRARGWPFVDDPSNTSQSYARGRLRAAADALAREGLDARRLARLARRAARAEAALDAAAQTAFVEARRPAPAGEIALDARVLAGLPEEIALRVLSRCVALLAPQARPRLARAEALHDRLAGAIAAGAVLRTTIAGVLVTHRAGVVGLALAPPRRAVSRTS